MSGGTPAGSTRPGTLKAWVYEMAGNLVIDAHRRRAVRPALASLDAADEGGEARRSARARDPALAGAGAGRPAAARAPRGDRASSTSRGLSVRAAAERLRIPEGTVKSRCYYALESLRVALEEQGLP